VDGSLWVSVDMANSLEASIADNFGFQDGQTHPIYPPDSRKCGFARGNPDALANELQ
jgi:hypothetical protein